MAFFIMLPDGTTGTNEWTNTGGASYHESVQSDDDDSTFVYETRPGHEITFTMADPSVVEAGIDFNEDVTVRPTITAHYYNGGSGTVAMTIMTTGTDILLAAQTRTIIVDDTYPSYNGVSGTSKSFGNTWDYTGLENIQVRLECTGTPARFTALRVSYVYVRVDYTAAVAADNATFFGANF
jgi:hypothetical protein